MINVAAHIGAWGRRWPGSPPPLADAGVPPVGFPATLLRIRVELYLGGTWVDVSDRVLYGYRIRIQRGRRPNQRKTTAASCALTFRNEDMALSPRNRTGPWFGLLRQNTPIRVYVNPGGGDSLRFKGNVPSWQPAVRGHPNDRRVSIVAYGTRNRLERPDAPQFESAQKRYLSTAPVLQTVLAYRSLEDGDFPSRVTGPAGSGPLPDLARGGVASDNIASGWMVGGDNSWAVEIDAMYPLGEGIPGSNACALRWDTVNTLSGWRLIDDTSGIGLIYYTTADGLPHSIRSLVNAYDGLWHHYRVTATQNGTGIDVVLYQDGASIMSATIASATLGRNTFWLVQDDSPGLGAARMPAVGHVVFYLASINGPSSYRAFQGWTGETPAERFLRLLGEEGIDGVVDELTTDQILMGPQQGKRTLTQLLQDCEDASEGLIDETFDNLLRLSTLRSRYNREVQLAIDYGAGQVLPPFEPDDGDETLINRWTLSRPDGGEATYEHTAGPLNSADPEDDQNGVGLYPQAESVNLNSDDALYVSAGWRVHRDTVDEPRYPGVRIELAAHPGLIPSWLSCDIGSRVLLEDGPDDVGSDDPDEILEGYAEEFDQVSWDIDAFLMPASVYRVAEVAGPATYGVDTPRLDCGASVLAAALAADFSAEDNFEDGVAAWTPNAATFTSSSAVPGYVGTLSGLLTVSGSPAQAYARREIAVTAGQIYTVSLYVYSVAGYADVSAAIDWYDSGHGYLSTTSGGSSALGASAWAARSASGTAPAGAAYAQFGPTIGSTPTGQLLYVDHVQWLTTFTVNILDNCVWTHAYGDYPIVIDDEDMLVVAVAAAGGAYPAQTQVLSVLRGCNGDPIAHFAGNAVHVRHPLILAR